LKAVSRKYGIQGSHTVSEWLRKYGTFDWENQSREAMNRTPQQRILELEERVRQLEREKESLREQAMRASDKAEVLDRVIQIVEREYEIPLLKKILPGQSVSTQEKAKRR
jgi:transposase-like protein